MTEQEILAYPTQKERRLAVLKDTVEYYSADPVGRRCNIGSRCRYSPKSIMKPSSEGCGIGRLVPPSKAEYYDMKYPSLGVLAIYEADDLPKYVRDLGIGFLIELQGLHDSIFNWNTEGLTPSGKLAVERIEELINNS